MGSRWWGCGMLAVALGCDVLSLQPQFEDDAVINDDATLDGGRGQPDASVFSDGGRDVADGGPREDSGDSGDDGVERDRGGRPDMGPPPVDMGVVEVPPGHVLCEGPIAAATPCNGCPEGTIVPPGWICVPGGVVAMRTVDPPTADQPERRVQVPAFLLQQAPVTFRAYQACVDAGRCDPPHVDDGSCNVKNGAVPNGLLPVEFRGIDQPVVCVDWNQAQQYAAWVSGEIAGARLPTSAEREYAASGGGRSTYPWGDQAAGCPRNAMQDGDEGGCGRGSTWPTCQFPNSDSPQGACDLAGNVQEWVQDCYHDDYRGAPRSAEAWEVDCQGGREVRGCAWNSPAYECDASYRYASEASHRDSDYGFRLVAPLPN